jgi:hypothetical protein
MVVYIKAQTDSKGIEIQPFAFENALKTNVNNHYCNEDLVPSLPFQETSVQILKNHPLLWVEYNYLLAQENAS